MISKPFPSLVALLWTCSTRILRCPTLNTAVKLRHHQCRVQGQDDFPSPAHHTIPDPSQDAIGLLGHLGTQLAHVQSSVNQHPQIHFLYTVFQPLCPKSLVVGSQNLIPIRFQVNELFFLKQKKKFNKYTTINVRCGALSCTVPPHDQQLI